MTLFKDILKPEEYENIKKELIFDDLDTIQVKDMTINQLSSLGLIFFKHGSGYFNFYMYKSLDLVTYSYQIILDRCIKADKAIF